MRCECSCDRGEEAWTKWHLYFSAPVSREAGGVSVSRRDRLKKRSPVTELRLELVSCVCVFCSLLWCYGAWRCMVPLVVVMWCPCRGCLRVCVCVCVCVVVVVVNTTSGWGARLFRCADGGYVFDIAQTVACCDGALDGSRGSATLLLLWCAW